METPKAKDLVFTEMNGGPDNLSCNCCGNTIAPTDSPKIATIDITNDSDFSIIVCSEKCETDFKNNPHADGYIMQTIAEILRH